MSLRKRVRKNEYINRGLSDKIYNELKLESRGIDPKEFHLGMNIELEHFDLTKGDLMDTAKITLAHLRELPDYNTRLKYMEKDAEKQLDGAKRRRKRGRVYNTLLFDDIDDD